MDTTTIEYAIYEADIPTGDALEGGCGPIARALRDVFGGQYAVVLDEAGLPRHAAVYVNGTLYDGTGRTSIETLCSLFVGEAVESAESIEESDHIDLRDRLDGFRRDSALTQEVAHKLRASVD